SFFSSAALISVICALPRGHTLNTQVSHNLAVSGKRRCGDVRVGSFAPIPGARSIALMPGLGAKADLRWHRMTALSAEEQTGLFSKHRFFAAILLRQPRQRSHSEKVGALKSVQPCHLRTLMILLFRVGPHDHSLE